MDRKKAFLTISLLIILFFLLIIAFTTNPSNQNNVEVALLRLDGIISTSKTSFLGGFDVEAFRKKLQEIGQDDSFKGLILVVNSPGGTPVAVDLIAKELDKVKEKKPVVIVIEEVGASGAYWIAANASYIIAHPLSLVGSIGVTSSYLEFAKFLEEHNITYVELHRGQYKEMGSPFKELTPEEKEIFDKILDEIYTAFKDRVKKGRNLTAEELDKVDDAQIFLGREALSLGLVDELGNVEEAKNFFKAYYNVSNIVVQEVKARTGLLDLLFGTSFKGQVFNTAPMPLNAQDLAFIYWQPLLLYK